MEEILRLFLVHKGNVPKKKTFIKYIEVCKDEGYFSREQALINDFTRLSRNGIHLEKVNNLKDLNKKTDATIAVNTLFKLIDSCQ